MTAINMNETAASAESWGRRTMRTHAAEIRSEFMKMVRMPAYAIPTLTFPPLFYLLFGVAFSKGGPQAKYLFATYGVFGALGAALFGFGVSVAIERGQGWLTLKMATPMPVSAYFVAKIVLSMIFSFIVYLLLSLAATQLGGVEIGLVAWLALAGVVVSGSLVYCAMGLAIGTLAGPNSAPALVNIVYLPVAILSGLWFPVSILPSWLQAAAPLMPAYHHGQIALAIVNMDGGGNMIGHAAAMLGFLIVFMAIATAAWRRSAEKLWG